VATVVVVVELAVVWGVSRWAPVKRA